MGLIPAESLDAIRSRLDIAELVREYVPELKRAGRNLKGRCPFHQERTPSFIVSPERQSFHCFGCGEGGDAFAFVMKLENLSFSEAVEKLAQRAGVVLAPVERSLEPAERERLKLKEALGFARDFYHELLKSPEGGAGRSYLSGRGIAAESVEKFGLGFAPGRSNLLGMAVRKGFAPELMAKAGLAAAKDGGSHRDYFFNRVLYPIRDARGAVVGFGARSLGDAQPKYLNSPDSPVFSKGRVLYGLFEGLGEIRKARRAVLMEGYMDVIAAHQYGFPLACAPLGTALTPDQAALLKRYVSDVTLVFDADNAGQTASVRGAEILLAQGLSVRIATVPGGKDPDEHLRDYGVESFTACLEKAVDLVEFKTEQVLKGQKEPLSPEAKASVAKEVMATISQSADEVLKGEWVRRLAQRLRTSEEAMLRQLGKTAAPAAKKAPPRVSEARLSPADQHILLLLLKSPALAHQVSDSDLDSAAARRIKAALASGETGALAEADKAVLSPLRVDPRPVTDPERELMSSIERRRREARLKELTAAGEFSEEYKKLIVAQKGSKK